MLEFIEADKTLVLEQANTSIMQSHPQVQDQSNTSIIQSHSQAYYTSRKLTEIIVQSETDELDYEEDQDAEEPASPATD
uniref:Uncharacterized protein n=1 Tax=Rhizophagus irregularis (strain DAOM 181602 / DAOM 197198 / MUCL 43194) TaxID=747089 RepID=U9THZ4_RHIID